MDPKTRITSAKAMEDEYFQDKVDGLPQGNHFEINICKVGCVLIMVVSSLLPQANYMFFILEDVFGDDKIVYPKREYLTEEEKNKAKVKKPAHDDNPAPQKRPRLDEQVLLGFRLNLLISFLETNENEKHEPISE